MIEHNLWAEMWGNLFEFRANLLLLLATFPSKLKTFSTIGHKKQVIFKYLYRQIDQSINDMADKSIKNMWLQL